MQTRKLCVFPYGPEVEYLPKYNGLLAPGYSIAALVAPAGWDIASTDAMPVFNKLEEVTAEYNTLFIPHFDAKEELETSLIHQIANLPAPTKDIICAKGLFPKNRDKLQALCKANQAELTYLPEKQTAIKSDDCSEETCDPINIPIIVVAGLWENTNKFEISLGLRKQFLENGLHITQIGSRNYCEMLGFHSFPTFMYQPGIQEKRKVYLLNQYVKELAAKEKSDAVVITIPGAIAPFSEDFPGDYGILAFLTANALSIDYLIVSTLFDTLSEEFLKNISLSCKYMLGVEADCFHISNYSIDPLESREKNRIEGIRMPQDITAVQLDRLDQGQAFPAINATTEQGQKELFRSILNKLSAEAVQIIT